MKKTIALIIAVVMACAMFAACSGNSTSETSSEAPAASSSEAPAASSSEAPAASSSEAPAASSSEAPAESSEEASAPAGDIKTDIVIGYSYPTRNNEFWGNALTFIEQAGSELGFTVEAVDANNKQEKQVDDVNNLLSTGIDGLVLAPQDASVVPGILDACKAKDVPVIIVDRYPGDELTAGEDYIAFIGPDDEEAGYAEAMALIDGGCTKLVGIGGYQGTSVAEGRKAGLDRALEENPDVELLQFVYAGENMDEGDEAFRNLQQANPDLDGVWCYNDSLALATVNVLVEEGKIGDVKVGGMDLLGPALESMRNGELWFSTGGHYMQSADAAIILFDSLNGVDYLGEPITKLKLIAATQNDLDKYDAKYGEGATLDWKSLSRAYNPDADQNFDLSLD